MRPRARRKSAVMAFSSSTFSGCSSTLILEESGRPPVNRDVPEQRIPVIPEPFVIFISEDGEPREQVVPQFGLLHVSSLGPVRPVKQRPLCRFELQRRSGRLLDDGSLDNRGRDRKIVAAADG